MGKRNPVWTEKEDLLLADTVLRCVREGGTQIQACKEIAEKLENRTEEACAFRWNNRLRSKYAKELELAKKGKVISTNKKVKAVNSNTNKPKSTSNKTKNEDKSPVEIKLESLVDNIEGLKRITNYLEENIKKESEKQNDDLKVENKTLKEELATLKQEYDEIVRDYHAMMHIMDRARRRGIVDSNDNVSEIKKAQ